MTDENTLGKLGHILDLCVKDGIIDQDTALRIEQLHYASERLDSQDQSESLKQTGPASTGFPYAPLLIDEPPDPKMTFASLVPCKVNAFTLEVANIIAREGGGRSAYNPLYVYGAVGMGKTHLLSAISNACDSHKWAAHINLADLEVEFERAQRLQARAELRDWLFAADLLLLDDIELCAHNEQLQRELYVIMHHMMRNGRGVVVASEQPPTRLEGFTHRLHSLLVGSLIAGLHLGESEERFMILKHFLPDIDMQPGVLEYLAEHLQDNIRRLEWAAKQLTVAAQRDASSVTLELARDLVCGEEAVAIEPPPKDEVVSQPTGALAGRFKEMLAEATTEEEQALALQIAIGERLRQLRDNGADTQIIERLEEALSLLREGKVQEAIQHIS